MNHIDLYKNPNLINWRMPIVIDFETYYDKDYSLKKITTEKYIRCDKFECIGLSIKIGDMPSKFYKRETGLGILQVILTETYPTSPVVCLNASFDMGILGLRYNIHPNFMVDVGVLAKLCGLDRVAKGGSLSALAKFLQSRGTITQEKGTEVHNMIGVHADDMSPEQWVAYGNYCNLDVDLTYQLYKYMIHSVPISERIMADITTRMWTNPLIDLDVPLLQAYNARLLQEKQQMLANLAPTLGYNDVDTLLSALRSKTEFPKILGKFVEVPTKWSEKQQCTVFATAKTDTAFTALLEHEDLRVQAIVEAKLGVSSNIEETRSGRFLDIATRGLMPIPLRYASAHTGRYGGSDKINVQNLGKRTKEPVLRQAMRAKDGYIVVGTDSSQIEARLLNFLANQTDVVDIFRQKKDVYLYMASSIYNESYEDLYAQSKGPNATKEGKTKRNLGKTTELGAGYGASAEKFANLMEQSGLSDMVAMAEQSIMAYRNSHKQVVNFWQTCQTALKVMHGGGSMWFGGPNNDLLFADGNSTFHGVRIPSIRFPNGTYLFYQNLREEIFEGRTNLVYDQFKGRRFESTRIWGSKCAENVTQKLAFDILKWQAIEIAKRGVSINLNVHDEWVSIVPKELGAYTVKTHYECMKAVPEYIPQGLLDCEVDFGLSYGDTKTIDVGSVL